MSHNPWLIDAIIDLDVCRSYRLPGDSAHKRRRISFLCSCQGWHHVCSFLRQR
ncbi:hypothetical protein BDY19DRAFT_917095 [Irpex rosettiformis]|uniref:Uncharacterized protein n=1 Tax=Irpex rosettiformis TaxID=378272 RepID=A0ACB8ULU0_9APHY|nr:hypothetical protein BDY19DRAFT_917095 [Irpex rosettiformis]